ncbi:MAG: hypothetical protein GEV08_09150 [Acidimicrobiia bacterium]|nr:hypothetical protein [Acidimicrobiia bacterium]
MLTPLLGLLEPRPAPPARRAPRALPGPGRVPWVVALLVSLAVTVGVVAPLAIWAERGEPSRRAVPGPRVELGLLHGAPWGTRAGR